MQRDTLFDDSIVAACSYDFDPIVLGLDQCSKKRVLFYLNEHPQCQHTQGQILEMFSAIDKSMKERKDSKHGSVFNMCDKAVINKTATGSVQSRSAAQKLAQTVRQGTDSCGLFHLLSWQAWLLALHRKSTRDAPFKSQLSLLFPSCPLCKNSHRVAPRECADVAIVLDCCEGASACNLPGLSSLAAERGLTVFAYLREVSTGTAHSINVLLLDQAGEGLSWWRIAQKLVVTAGATARRPSAACGSSVVEHGSPAGLRVSDDMDWAFPERKNSSPSSEAARWSEDRVLAIRDFSTARGALLSLVCAAQEHCTHASAALASDAC